MLRRKLILVVTLALLGTLVVPATAGAIVGGEPAPPGRWPWMAALLYARQANAWKAQFCGAVIIAPRRVLTAGHCVEDTDSAAVDVLVGRTRLSTSEGRRIRVASISLYPQYVNGSAPGLDAAVLTLRDATGAPPVALAGPGQEAGWAPGTLAWALGWGQINRRTSPGGWEYYADRLRELQEPVAGDDACESAYGGGWWDLPYRPDWWVCAGTADDRFGTCYGDSGGPLVVGTAQGWLDVGIDVASDSCASKGYYDLDTRVDRISAFALGAHPAVQPASLRRPRVAGPLRAGARVRCKLGRWRGRGMRFTVAWRRHGVHRAIGHGRTHRVSAGDVRGGLRCAVTARTRGGYRTVASRPAQKPSRKTSL